MFKKGYEIMGTLNDIYEYVRSGETEKERLGLEIEHFIINEVGVQITFEEVTPLIEKVGRETGAKLLYVDGHVVGYANDKYSVTLEPSCQFEISINPYSALDEIEKIYQEFRGIWDPIFAGRGYHFVAKGNLPLVECGIITPDAIPLSPKKRYEYMDAYFRTSGKYGKYMMRASASTQVSIDYWKRGCCFRRSRSHRMAGKSFRRISSWYTGTETWCTPGKSTIILMCTTKRG